MIASMYCLAIYSYSLSKQVFSFILIVLVVT